MSDLVDTCLEATKRTYPDGYGFALVYLDQNPGPDALKNMRDQAFHVVKRQAMNGNPDAAKFVAAYAESVETTPHKGWPWFLIEAAQLVHASAMGGDRLSEAVMRQWKHPGY